MPSPRRTLLVAAVLVGLGLRGMGLMQPWDGADWHSALGGFGTGAYARNFAEHGFAESWWMPYRWSVRLADGSVERFWYTHHPALYSVLSGLAVRLLGAHTWALHVPSLLFSALSLGACWRLAAALGGAREAALATSFFALLPMGVYYGILPWAEVPIAWLHMEAGAAYVAWWRTRSRRALALLLACIVLGGLLDWPAHFLLPALCVHLACTALRRREPARWAAVAWMGLAAALPILVHWLHFRLVEPHAHRVDTANTLSWVTQLTIPVSRWLAFQGTFLERYYGLAILVPCAAALAAQVLGVARGRQAFENGLRLALLTPALFYVGLFPARSTNHDFFWYLSLPWVALSCGQACGAALERLRGAARRLAGAAAALLLAGGAVHGYGLWRAKDTQDFPRWRATPLLHEALDDPRNVVVASAARAGLLHFFARAPLISGVLTVPELERLRDEVLARTEPDRPVLFLFDPSVLAEPSLRAALLPLREALERHGTLVASDARASLELFDIGAWAHGQR